MAKNPLRLWTIQRKEAWDVLRKTGFLYADEQCVLSEFLPAYRWMAEQMKKRLPGCSGRLPVWAWHKPKPDLRRSGHLERGVLGVRLELLVPADRVLLSDFDAWHCVLNRWYLSLTEEEDARWKSRLPKGYRPGDELPPELERELRASWERIFDLELVAKSGWVAKEQRVQAALERIELADVVGVRGFVALYQKARANSEEAERSLDLARSEYRKKTQEYIAEVSAQCQARRRAVEKEYLSKVTALEAEKERILNRKWSLDSVTDYRAAEIDFQVAEIDYQIADLVSERDQKLMQLEELERRRREEAEVKARKESGIENVQQRCDEAQKALDEAEAHLYRVEFLLDTGRE